MTEALAFLHVAAEANLQHATVYAAIIDGTATDAEVRQLQAAAGSGDTSAINFLGLKALTGSDTNAATDHWLRSANLGDWAAPLLLGRLSAHRSQ